MKLDKSVQIWRAASEVKERPHLSFVQFDAKAATLTATNSYIAARVPCDVEDGDESGLIPAAALKEAKGRSLRIADGHATLTVDGGDRRWELGEGPFPDVEAIYERADEIASPVGINSRLAACLGEALGGGATDLPLILHPVHPLRPMRVTTTRGGLGILMPIRLGDSNSPLAPDLSDDARIIAAARAAIGLLEKKRGKKKAAQAFRDVLLSEEAA